MSAPDDSAAADVRRSPWADGLGRAAIRCLQVLVVTAVVVLVTYVAVRLRLVVVPVLIATLIAAAVSPIVGWLARRGLPRALAVWVALLTFIAVLGGIGWFVGNAFAAQFGELRTGVTDGIAQLRTFAQEGPLNLSEQQLEAAGQAIADAAQQADFATPALSGATAVVEAVAGLFLGAVVLYFLLKDGAGIWRFLMDQVPSRRYRTRLFEVGNRATGVLGGYVRGTAVIALVDAIVIGVALAILGVPLALPLAVIVFVGAFIPLVGATIAGFLAALIALVSSGPLTALIVVGVVVAVNQIEGDVLAPVVLGRSLRLHPLAILLALAAGTIIAGIIGAILAVPFAAVAWSAVTTWREMAGRPPERAYASEQESTASAL